MKTLIVVLILLSFLQVTVIPANLVLIILILRAYLFPAKENLYLGFFFGLLISYLEPQSLGIYSLVFLSFIQVIHLIRKTPFSMHFLVMIPAVIIVLILDSFFQGLLTKSSVYLWPGVFMEALLAVPIYFVLKIWEERFVVKPEVKLRI